MTDAPQLDVVVVGGGPAGLAAGLWLGRYGRRVRIVDSARPRNRYARAVHGYPGVPDLPPEELRARLHGQATAAGAEYLRERVHELQGTKDAFRIVTGSGTAMTARRVLLAYGRHDRLPELPGIEELLGSSAFHCPDCDGPSVAGQSVAVLGADLHAAALALFLLTWTNRLTLLANGQPARLDERTRTLLRRHEIGIREEQVLRVQGSHGRLDRIVLAPADHLAADALFFHPASSPSTDLAERLGCVQTAKGDIRTGEGQQTNVPGVFAAGDITGHPHLTIAAAAQGVSAALAMHRSLLPEEFDLA